jgi:RNA 2',3'-cyclic 3'-phosphodiesterase
MRLFVAIALPEDLRERLAALQHGLPGARWVAPENLHLTLRFIGEADRRQTQDLDAALAAIRVPRFSLSLAGLGHFGSERKLRSLWVGLDPCEALNRLQAKVALAPRRADLAPSGQKFRPHVTLARFKAKPGARHTEFIARHALFRAAPFAVEDFVLFSSFLGQGGPIYRAEARYPLVQSPDRVML